jgi:DNA invertase Pin-like site-specific DNA recombinase
MIFGYARVSRDDQNIEMQIDALKKANANMIFTDVGSGAVFNRPELKKLMEVLKPGDTVIIWKFDRLSRSIKDLILLLDLIQKHGAKWISLSEGLDSSKAMDKMMISFVGILAENERDNIIQRTLCGLNNAKRKGIILGRPPIVSKIQREYILKAYSKGEMTMRELSNFLQLSYSTVRRVLAQENDKEFVHD